MTDRKFELSPIDENQFAEKKNRTLALLQAELQRRQPSAPDRNPTRQTGAERGFAAHLTAISPA